jgi:hypothetical protein
MAQELDELRKSLRDALEVIKKNEEERAAQKHSHAAKPRLTTLERLQPSGASSVSYTLMGSISVCVVVAEGGVVPFAGGGRSRLQLEGEKRRKARQLLKVRMWTILEPAEALDVCLHIS